MRTISTLVARLTMDTFSTWILFHVDALAVLPTNLHLRAARLTTVANQLLQTQLQMQRTHAPAARTVEFLLALLAIPRTAPVPLTSVSSLQKDGMQQIVQLTSVWNQLLALLELLVPHRRQKTVLCVLLARPRSKDR